MNFTEEQILIAPGYSMRGWDSCNYSANGVELFHERTYFPHNPFKPIHSEQWINGTGTRAEVDALAVKHGGHAVEEFYAPEGADTFFLAFSDNGKAIAFCRTPDFDALSLTSTKL